MKRCRGTGSLRLRGRIWQARFLHNGQTQEVSTGTADRKEAEKFLAKQVKAANTELFIDPATRRLDSSYLVYLVRADAVRKGNRSARRLVTQELPTEIVRHLTSYFHGPIRNVTSNDVDRYGDLRIEEGAKPATVNRELAV